MTKLTCLFLFLGLMQVSATGYSQNVVSVNFKDTKVSKVFHYLEKKSGYVFYYNNDELKGLPNVSLELKGAPISEVMDSLMKGTSLGYKIMNNNLVIILNKNESDVIAQPVHGRVTDSLGNPLIGVTVQVKGTSTGTVTNLQGDYKLNAPDNGTLVFSFIGYQSKEVMIGGNEVVNVTLSVSHTGLNEVVVVAYGQTTKRDVNSAISTLDMKNVAPIPVASINDAVSGRIPGVIVTASSGEPGAKSSVSIRGGGTPLYVIDGIIRSQNDFLNLDPNDIATYSVLKDVSATSLYGARGGNGVILVTTKKGEEGKMSINYSFNQIFSQPTINPTKLSSYQHAFAINKVYQAEGKTPPTPDSILQYYRDQSKPFLYSNTKWRALFLKEFAPEQRHDLSVSSGTRKLTYYASGSYFHQGTILKTDHNFNNRITYRLNTVSNFDNIGLTVNTDLDGFVEQNETPNSSTANGFYQIFSHIQNHAPSQLAYNNMGLPSANTTDNSAVELSPLSGYNSTTSRVFNSILSMDWAVPWVQGLHIKGKGSYNMWNSIGKSWSATAPSYDNNSTVPIPGNPPSLGETWGEGSMFTLQGFLTYARDFGKHHIDFTGVYEQQQNQSGSLSGSRQQYQIIFDQFLAGPTENMQAGGGESENANASYLGRLSYNYASKYFLDATLRYDGMDLFPPGKRWGAFYALAGGWIVSAENFFQPIESNHILDYLKLRGSTGLTGTVDGISAFQYISGYNVNANAWVVGGQEQQGTSEPGTLPSTNFSWYSMRSWDLGFDFESLNSRLSGSVDYFYKRTTGYVAPDTRYAATLGIGLPPVNDKQAALRRAGADFDLRWKDNISSFTYQIGFNFTYFNELWERTYWEDEAALMNPYTRTSGTSDANLQTGYITQGIIQNNNDLLQGPRRIASTNVVAGDLRYIDENGDGKIDGNDFRRIGTNTFPRINYGFTLDLGYKGIYMSAVLMGSGNRDRYLGDVIQGGSAQAQLVYAFQEDYWTPENKNALFPRAVSSGGVNGNNNFTSSNYWLLRSQYIRLKYFQLGYDLKASILKRSPFTSLKVFVSGTNLLTRSKSLKYFIDPESDPNNYNYPIQRTISFGVNVGF